MAGEIVLTVVGNLTSDPELRYTQSGLAVANLTIASSARTFDRATNDWKDGETTFLRCTVWRDHAENVAKSLRKGTNVICQGALRQRSYETKEGEKRTTFELDVLSIGPTLLFATAEVTRAPKSGVSAPEAQLGGDGFTPFVPPAEWNEMTDAPAAQGPRAV